MIKRILIIVIVLALSIVKTSNSFASTPIDAATKEAFQDFYIGIGLSGIAFFNDNPSWKHILNSPDKNDVLGGSFDGLESGFHLSVMTNLNESSSLLLPISFEYDWLTAAEQMYQTSRTKLQVKHSIDIQKLGIGLQWQFLTFPFKDVKGYMEADLKVIFINNQEYRYVISELETDGTITSNLGPYNPKETAVRFGAEYKLGFRGQLTKNFFINSFLGIELLNVLGRNDDRGELLTPWGSLKQMQERSESKEQYVPNLHFVLIVLDQH